MSAPPVEEYRSALTKPFAGGPLNAAPPRFLLAIVLGLAVSLSFFTLLHTIVSRHLGGAKSSDNLTTIDFIRINRNFELDTRTREKPKPEKPDKPQPTPMAMNLPQQKVEGPTTKVDVSVGSMDVSTDVNVGTGMSLSKNDLANDGEYLPIVKIEPIYPPRAQERGVEGYVLLRFTVTSAGTVIDPVVLESEPKGVFDESATKAALKFKYKPRIENGKPVSVPNVEHAFTFKLDKKKGR